MRLRSANSFSGSACEQASIICAELDLDINLHYAQFATVVENVVKINLASRNDSKGAALSANASVKIHMVSRKFG
jgi:hypothetical protein